MFTQLKIPTTIHTLKFTSPVELILYVNSTVRYIGKENSYYVIKLKTMVHCILLCIVAKSLSITSMFVIK